MTDKKPPSDQATHGSGKRSAEHTSSDRQRFVGSRSKIAAEADVAPQERDEPADHNKKPLKPVR